MMTATLGMDVAGLVTQLAFMTVAAMGVVSSFAAFGFVSAVVQK